MIPPHSPLEGHPRWLLPRAGAPGCRNCCGWLRVRTACLGGLFRLLNLSLGACEVRSGPRDSCRPRPPPLPPPAAAAPHAGGSSPQTRRAAAAQIAGILRSHPAQLPAVLAEVAALLRHKDWEARVAAGHCLGLIALHFEHHTGGREGADHLHACTVDSDWLLLLLLLLLPPPAVSIRHPGHPLPLPLRPAAASLCADAGIAAPPASQPGAEANPSAAAAAAAAACAAVKREEPEPSAEGSAGAAAAAAAAAAEQALRLASFDVRRVLEQGTPLLASGGEVGRGGGWGPWGSGCLPGAAAAADAGWASLLLLLSALLWTCVLLRVRCPAAAAAANLHPLPWHATALPVLLLPPPPPRSTTWRWRRGSAGTRPWPRSGPR